MNALSAAFAAAGAAAWGAADYARLVPHMPPTDRERAECLCPGAQTVLVAAFPYFGGNRDGNLSLYARGADYHQVLVDRLNTICHILKEKYPQDLFCPAADTSPLPERTAAWLSGVGLRGKNGLLIVPPHGSYVFLGTILTTARLAGETQAAPDCISCGKCLVACPTGALGGDGLDVTRCLSHLTQKKGVLPPEETALVAAHPLIWGCDLCQTVCPYNADAPLSPLPEFRENLLNWLEQSDLEGLTRRDFQARYGGRAFAWRGSEVLRRNLSLQHE